MLKKCYYYAQKVPLLCSKFFPRITHFLPPFWKLEYKWVPASQSPHVATSVTCGEVWSSRLSRIFLHRKSGIPISRLYLIPMYLFIYLFSIFWHISLNFSYYYAGVMLDAHASLLCSKLCGIMWTTLAIKLMVRRCLLACSMNSFISSLLVSHNRRIKRTRHLYLSNIETKRTKISVETWTR